MEWLNPANTKSSQLLVKAGDAFRMSLAHSEKNAEVILAGGAKKTYTIDPNANEFVFGDTFKQGTYRLRIGTNETMFCVDLLDAQESNTKPRDELQLGRYTKVTATTTKRTNMELWRTIAMAGLGMLMLEWWYYHRRTV